MDGSQVNINQLQGELSTVKVPVGNGVFLRVTYFVDRYTSEFLFRHRGHATYVMLSELIKDWDLTIYTATREWQDKEIIRRRNPETMDLPQAPKPDLDGSEEETYPINEGHMSFLRMRLVNAISRAIAEDQNPNWERGEDSESSF